MKEAAKIDGCNEFDTLWRITLPIAKTIFMTIALLVFVHVWSEFLWANTFITDESLKSVATRVVKFVGEYTSDMTKIYTVCTITILLIIALFQLFSRKFVERMTIGSVKG